MKIENEKYEAIKKLSLPEILRNYGMQLKSVRSWGLLNRAESYQTLCPFHEEKTPSLNINFKKDKWLWNCFGCGKGGNVIDFVMGYEKISFKEAYEKLSGKGDKSEGEENVGARLSRPEESVANAEQTIPRGEILARVVEIYHQSLCEDKRGQDYLAQRGIKDGELIREHKLGFANGKLKEILPATQTHETIQALKELGVLNEKGNEHFYNCVVFPIYNENGAVVGMYGRNIEETASIKHLYLRGERKGVWNWQAIKSSQEIILTESIIDALSAWELGERNVVPMYGVNGLTPDHERLMKEYRTQKVRLCFDNDEAGRDARERVKEKIMKLGIEVENLFLPSEYKDLNEVQTRGGIFPSLKEKNSLYEIERPLKYPELEQKEEGIYFDFGKRKYRIRGLGGKTTENLRVNLKVEHNDENSLNPSNSSNSSNYFSHLDTFDLYSAKSRTVFIGQCRKIFKAGEGEMERELNLMVGELEKIKYLQEDKKETESGQYVMSAEEEKQAVSALKSKTLMGDILKDMEELGYIGEEANKMIGYLVSISRKLEDPLSCVVNSQSSAGKSVLVETVEKLVSPEDCIFLSKMTMNSLYYMEKTRLKRKVVIMEERVGAEAADYSIRTLQSRKKLTQAVPVKDPKTGKIKTEILEVEGPIAYIETTTRPRIHEENATRCFELYLDESSEQTMRIQKLQRDSKNLNGFKRKQEQANLMKKHHNMQRILKTVKVVIPYAEYLKFPTKWLRTRRDHMRFLNLIEVITFLHQQQREVKRTEEGHEYIESTVQDYEAAYALARQVMGESFTELKKPQRELLKQIETMVKGSLEEELTRRQIREFVGIPDTRLRDLLQELVDLEYLLTIEGKQGKSFRYRLSERNIKAEQIIEGLTTPEELEKQLKYLRVV